MSTSPVRRTSSSAAGRTSGAPAGRAGGSPADLVRAFHHAFGLDVRDTPSRVAPALAAHRGELLAEEATEVAEVSVEGPLDRLAHELADVVYVAYGTALVHGIDLDAVIAEIHRSNMTKLGPDGQVSRRADGKVLKGEHYEAPDVAGVLRRQGWTPDGEE
ncbi:MazG nucleotide pyrophosphohydrolase domain-containing protein [Streptomyces sp. ISL-12]|uniref:MazG nucleotide pyrophosphohydrolase domain-containing protein n=1 Tax=Streptomyces sp. ISL-12 TaxID=2819177 RepID=UPI00203578A5|nr:MazG nucleotide pyrophosphohydrolase domain-containing protein [Streptomyces sp. ISL-12]